MSGEGLWAIFLVFIFILFAVLGIGSCTPGKYCPGGDDYCDTHSCRP